MEFSEGTPCWAQLLTPDADAARGFYGALFGWTFDDRLCLAGGRPVAQITQAPGEAWEVYLATHDVDSAVARVGAAGGSLLVEPFDLPGHGRYARAVDPAGVPFALWQAGEFTGGGPAWLDLNTRGGAEIDAFYAAVFGYTPEPVPGQAGYSLWRVSGRPVAGRLEMDEAEWAGVPAHWMAYFAVPDVDRAAERAAGLGGRVGYGPVDSPYGRLAIIGDPGGVPFTIIPAEGAVRAWG
ncbi:VOC family protein [Nonomuraea typhae]|uniref:VOC family protein n=1 Tax=Nonomuraea typhae TaxID=2603600 RepID=UPI0012F9D210|nr:VOC family protein [Nonomuraea typhae]